jgi:hypothetical protein
MRERLPRGTTHDVAARVFNRWRRPNTDPASLLIMSSRGESPTSCNIFSISSEAKIPSAMTEHRVSLQRVQRYFAGLVDPS